MSRPKKEAPLQTPQSSSPTRLGGLSPLALGFALLLLPRLEPALAKMEAKPKAPPTFRVFLDPGHGGKPEVGGKHTGAHWDPSRHRFLNFYRYGTEYRAKGGIVISEQATVLALAKAIEERLSWTRSDEGWTKFSELLSRFSNVLPPFHRVRFETDLARRNDYQSHPDKGKKDVNKHFRIFDGPASFPAKKDTPMIPGRLSRSASFSPQIQLSLHIDGSTNPKQRGMSALFVPSPKVFDTARKISLGKAKPTDVEKRMRRYWSYRGHHRTKLGWILNDTWTYFTGHGSEPDGKKVRTASYIGQRWEHLDWSYRSKVEAKPRTSLVDPFEGPFFEREASRFEGLRRGGGPEGVGGDNLYAGQELLRFLRYAWWKDYTKTKVGFAKGLSAKAYLPPHEKPTAADWAMPLFSNAVSPYLELGQLWNSKDRYLLTEKIEAAADGLAVGLYALVAGFRVPEVPGLETPRGLPIAWSKYQTEDGSSYFERSHPRYRRQHQLEAAKNSKARAEARAEAQKRLQAAAEKAGMKAASESAANQPKPEGEPPTPEEGEEKPLETGKRLEVDAVEAAQAPTQKEEGAL